MFSLSLGLSGCVGCMRPALLAGGPACRGSGSPWGTQPGALSKVLASPGLRQRFKM